MKLFFSLCVPLLCATQLVIAAKATVTEQDRQLLDAVSREQITQVATLLKAGAKVNARHPPLRLTPLLVASETNIAMVRLLVTHGVNVNVQDRDGLTPLMKSLITRDFAMAVLLLDAGAAIDTRDYRGHTALTHAVLRSDPKILKLLIDRGAKLDVITHMGTTPWSMAKQTRTAALVMPKGVHVMSHHLGPSTQKAPPPHFSKVPSQSVPDHPMRSQREALAQTQAVLDLLSAAGATRPQQSVKNFDAMKNHIH